MTAHTTIRKTGLPPCWRVSVDGTTVATVETYVAAQEAAEAVWMADNDQEHITGRECITTRDPERSGYGWSKKSAGWLCNDAKDPRWPTLH